MQKKRRAHQAHEEDNMTSTCCFVISRSAVRVREVALTRGTCAEPTALHKDPQDPPTLPQGTNTTTHRTSCGNAAGLDPSTTRHTLRHAFWQRPLHLTVSLPIRIPVSRFRSHDFSTRNLVADAIDDVACWTHCSFPLAKKVFVMYLDAPFIA